MSLEVLKFVLGQSKAFALGSPLAFDYNLNDIRDSINNHLVNKNNPHEVNASQINLSSGNSIQFEITNILNRLNGTGANQHMWRRYNHEAYTQDVSSGFKSYGYKEYAASYSFDAASGEFSLVNPTNAEFSYDSIDYNAIGHYMIHDNSVIMISRLSDNRVQDGIDGSDNEPIYDEYCYIQYNRVISANRTNETILYSDDPNAYQEGVHDGYTYEYIGINTSNTIPSFAYGSYTGTGTFGESSPNRLEFSFKPVFLIITSNNYYIGDYCVIYILGQEPFTRYGSRESYISEVTFSDNAVSWYAEFSSDLMDTDDERERSTSEQMNTNGQKYYYFCVGY